MLENSSGGKLRVIATVVTDPVVIRKILNHTTTGPPPLALPQSTSSLYRSHASNSQAKITGKANLAGHVMHCEPNPLTMQYSTSLFVRNASAHGQRMITQQRRDTKYGECVY